MNVKTASQSEAGDLMFIYMYEESLIKSESERASRANRERANEV